MSASIREEARLAAEVILEECETALEADPPFECRSAIGRIRRQAQSLATAVLRAERADTEGNCEAEGSPAEQA